MAARPPYAGRVYLLDPVRLAELPAWTASADVMLMAIQPSSENHAWTQPQKLFEAMGTGTVDVNWAKEQHSLWLEQQNASSGANETRPHPTAAPAE